MARDPYKYFRVEGRELLDELTRLLMQAEKRESDKALVAKLLRLAHTLKGAAQVVKQTAIAQAAHAIEDILAPHRESPVPVPKEVADEALQRLAEIAVRIDALQSAEEVSSGDQAVQRTSAEALETVRVEVKEVEGLLASLSELDVQVTATRAQVEQVIRAKEFAMSVVRDLSCLARAGNGRNHTKLRSSADQVLTAISSAERGLTAALERAERELGQSQERANRLRLLPVDTIIPSLGRAAKEAAGALGKEVELETSGGNIRLDADILTVLQDALLHLIRNAVAHGIESPAARAAARKPTVGKITLKARRMGNRISFMCRDDGAGIDVSAIRNAAVKKGVISGTDAGSLGLREAVDLLLHGGLSTTNDVTGTSGRGLGLEIVHNCAQRLRGDVSVETTPGLWTSVEICVPASLTSLNALLVESEGVRAFIPLDTVRQSTRVCSQDIATSGMSKSVPYEEGAVPFVQLSDVLGQHGSVANRREHKTAVIVGSGDTFAAIGVEKLLGIRSVLVRPLPTIAGAEAVVAGASLDAEGIPVVVLDAAPLIDAVRRGAATSSQAGQRTLPVLVIDDSLTTRMVEQNILESAGYQVETASSGEEAIRRAHLHQYCLFLVDIEMPGMDGFEFISQAHIDPLLRDVPSVLVSSRSSPADRRRAEELGARAYFVKSEFDQKQFLETVTHLVG
jgi:two-component system, chemotaxis family, sensor kinase CheA